MSKNTVYRCRKCEKEFTPKPTPKNVVLVQCDCGSTNVEFVKT